MKRPPLIALARYCILLGAMGFGGPVALANYMRRDLVERRSWIGETEFDRGLAIATASPGPMAYQLGVYCGFVTYGVPGALLIALAFAVPPFIIVVAIAAIYQRFAGADILRGLFYGIGPVVVALILRASWNLARKTLKLDYPAWFVALTACAATVIFEPELVWLFLGAGVLGILIFATRPEVQSASVPEPGPVIGKAHAFGLPAFLAVVAPPAGHGLRCFGFS